MRVVTIIAACSLVASTTAFTPQQLGQTPMSKRRGVVRYFGGARRGTQGGDAQKELKKQEEEMQATIAATEARMRAKLEAASEGSAPVLEKSGKAAAVVAKAPPPVPAKSPTPSPRAVATTSTTTAKGGDLTVLGAFVGA